MEHASDGGEDGVQDAGDGRDHGREAGGDGCKDSKRAEGELASSMCLGGVVRVGGWTYLPYRTKVEVAGASG